MTDERDAVSYLRISQDRAGDGLAVERQRNDIAHLAHTRGINLAREYCDTVSASGSKTREDFERLLVDIEAGGIATVAAWAWDRLSRASKDTLRLIDTCRVNRCRLVFVTDADMDVTTPGGELVASVRASVARNEIAQKSERQRAQRRQEAEQGRTPPSRRAFGYARRTRVAGARWPVSELDPVEAPLVADCYRQVVAGRSMGAIARWLTEQGSRTPAGREWNHHNLLTVLTNPRYKGVRGVRHLLPGRAGEQGRREQYHTEVATGTWTAIVDADTWEAAQSILRDPMRRDNHPVNTARYLLSGIARCGRCGQKLVNGSRSYVRADGQRQRDRLLVCAPRKHVVRKAEPVERWVEHVVLERLARPEAREVLRRAVAPPGVDLGDVRAQMAALRARRDEATAMWTDGELDSASMRLVHGRVDQRLVELGRALEASLAGDPLLELACADDPVDAWESWPMDQRRSLVATRLDVVVHGGKSGRPGGSRFDPSSVSVTWR